MSLSEFIRAFAEHNIIIPVLAVGMLISFLFGRRKKKKAGLSSGYEAAYYVFSFLADMTAAFRFTSFSVVTDRRLSAF